MDRITGFDGRDREGAKRANQRSASCLTSSCPALRAVQLSFERRRGAALAASPLNSRSVGS